jgi:hypothetical protein
MPFSNVSVRPAWGEATTRIGGGVPDNPAAALAPHPLQEPALDSPATG